MRRIGVVSLLLLAGCSGGAPNGPPGLLTDPATTAAVSLRNESPAPIVYVAAGEGTLALLVLRPTLVRHEYEDRVVPAGSTVPVRDIIGYDPALGITFHIYQVDAKAREARYAGYFLATAAELTRHGGLVTYDPLSF